MTKTDSPKKHIRRAFQPSVDEQIEIAHERQIYFDKTNAESFSGFIRLTSALLGGAFFIYFQNIEKPVVFWMVLGAPVVVSAACIGGVIVILENWRWLLDVRLTEQSLLGNAAPHVERILACGTEQVQMYLMIFLTFGVWLISLITLGLLSVCTLIALISPPLFSVLLIRRSISLERKQLRIKISQQRVL